MVRNLFGRDTDMQFSGLLSPSIFLSIINTSRDSFLSVYFFPAILFCRRLLGVVG